MNDQSLLTELSQHQFPHCSSPPLGIVLISPKTVCCKCGGPLFLRADRPSRMVIYDDKLGTLPATHYHKDCRKPQCRVHQYYGYHTIGDEGKSCHDDDCLLLPYFISTQKTAFSMTLRNYDTELLIGQVSYKQQTFTVMFMDTLLQNLRRLKRVNHMQKQQDQGIYIIH